MVDSRKGDGFSDYANRVSPRLVLDGAGWHTSQTFISPELNPVENVWEYLRKNKPALRVFDNYDASVDACCV